MTPASGFPRPRLTQTVLGRLVIAALQILVPTFALALFSFVQLDSHSERFSVVALEAAKEMGLVDGLLGDAERAVRPGAATAPR